MSPPSAIISSSSNPAQTHASASTLGTAPSSTMPSGSSAPPPVGANGLGKPSIYCCLPVMRTLPSGGICICSACEGIEEAHFCERERERDNKKRKAAPMVSTDDNGESSSEQGWWIVLFVAHIGISNQKDASVQTQSQKLTYGHINKKARLSIIPPVDGVYQTDKDLYAYLRGNRARRWQFSGTYYVFGPKMEHSKRARNVLDALKDNARVSFKTNFTKCCPGKKAWTEERMCCACRRKYCGGWISVMVNDMEDTGPLEPEFVKQKITVEITH